MKKPANRNSSHQPFALELDDLLHPARAFAHPCDVVNDPDLSLNEKRAILASWASDACAVEAAPALRCPPGESTNDVLEALRSLEKQVYGAAVETSWWLRQERRRSIEAFRGRRQRGQDPDRGVTHGEPFPLRWDATRKPEWRPG